MGTVRPDTSDVLRAIIREGDWYDAWGTAMEYAFAISHVLWHASAEEIPADWGYQHGAAVGCDLSSEDDGYATAEIFAQYETGAISDDALLYWGTIVCRYADMLKHYGHSY